MGGSRGGGGDSLPAGRIEQTLVRHGLESAVARRVHATGEAVMRRTVATGAEHAAMLDAGSGEPLGTILTGRANRTDISPHLDAMALGRSYVQIHSHPSGTTFSEVDLLLLLDNDQILLMVVPAAGGRWYILSDEPGASRNPAMVIELLREEMYDAWPAYRLRVELGELSTREADALARDDALVQLAERIGLRYDRLEP